MGGWAVKIAATPLLNLNVVGLYKIMSLLATELRGKCYTLTFTDRGGESCGQTFVSVCVLL